jgi:hypothetical protein
VRLASRLHAKPVPKCVYPQKLWNPALLDPARIPLNSDPPNCVNTSTGHHTSLFERL